MVGDNHLVSAVRYPFEVKFYGGDFKFIIIRHSISHVLIRYVLVSILYYSCTFYRIYNIHNTYNISYLLKGFY